MFLLYFNVFLVPLTIGLMWILPIQSMPLSLVQAYGLNTQFSVPYIYTMLLSATACGILSPYFGNVDYDY